MTLADEARRHLEVLAAEPRPAGGAAERAAREYCARVVRKLGFTVREEPFEYSSAPGRFATPAAGVAYLGVMAVAAHFGWRGQIGVVIAVLLMGALLIGVLAVRAVKSVLDFPWARGESVNLWAARGEPSVWLVAHLDSKSQPVPIGLRAAGITVMTVVMLSALIVALLDFIGLSTRALWPWLLVAGTVGAIPVALSVVGARSPGALDNATGVAAVLLSAAVIPQERPVGLLLTSAEELGLAGARAWAARHPPARAINFDGLDDKGTTRIWYGRRPPWELLRALERGARRAAIRARGQTVPLGILVDGVALAEHGWQVVTVTKGSWRTVARIHTPHDTASRLEGRGIVEAATLAAAVVEELT